MALRKPIVLKDGILEQLQSGDTLDAPVSSSIEVTLNNSNPSAINKCQVLYSDGPGTVDLARANSINTAHVVGFCAQNGITQNSPAIIHMEGILEATTEEWTAVVEENSTISGGVVYYLSPTTAGKITDTPPSTVGQMVVRVGIAISTTLFRVMIEPPIRL